MNELIKVATEYISSLIKAPNPLWEKLLLSSIIPTIIAGAIGILSALLTLEKTKTYDIKQKEKERKRSKCEEQLRALYNPVVFYLDQTTEFYKLFHEEGEQRTLERILKGETFEGDKKVLLELILTNNSAIQELVLKNAHLIETELWAYFVQLLKHYTIIRMAYEKKITDKDKYNDYVYPSNAVQRIKEKRDNIYRFLNEKKEGEQ